MAAGQVSAREECGRRAVLRRPRGPQDGPGTAVRTAVVFGAASLSLQPFLSTSGTPSSMPSGAGCALYYLFLFSSPQSYQFSK